ncbi:hypothetical protein [Flavobacterium franklandianum]|nr:hypothetical protein [Flavobacterium franklandianum]
MDKGITISFRPIERLLKHPNTDIGLVTSYIDFKKEIYYRS